MEYRRLGKSGLKVSALSYGSWVTFHNQVDLQASKEIFQACKDGGINFFDNAEAYADGQAETIMGQAFKELGWKRSEFVVSTKLFWGGQGVNEKGLSRKHILEGIKASLSRLQLDYVDLLYCHRPDPDTPIEETVRAMNHVINQGQALYWGTSEWSAEQLLEAWGVADKLGLIGPAMEQPEYNLFHRERVEKEYKEAGLYTKRGMGTTIWSPLASGVLTGKYSGGVAPADSRLAMENYKGLAERKLKEGRDKVDKVDQLAPVAKELGGSLAQLALAWCLTNPDVSSVILGATKVSQLQENLGALALVPKLTPEVLQRIEDIVGSKPQ